MPVPCLNQTASGLDHDWACKYHNIIISNHGTHCIMCSKLFVIDGFTYHYTDIIMTTMASQITSLMVVYSTVHSDADQRKHQSPASLAFVQGIHRDGWIPHTTGQLRGKCFHLMTSSCKRNVVDHGTLPKTGDEITAIFIVVHSQNSHTY